MIHLGPGAEPQLVSWVTGQPPNLKFLKSHPPFLQWSPIRHPHPVLKVVKKSYCSFSFSLQHLGLHYSLQHSAQVLIAASRLKYFVHNGKFTIADSLQASITVRDAVGNDNDVGVLHVSMFHEIIQPPGERLI